MKEKKKRKKETGKKEWKKEMVKDESIEGGNEGKPGKTREKNGTTHGTFPPLLIAIFPRVYPHSLINQHQLLSGGAEYLEIGRYRYFFSVSSPERGCTVPCVYNERVLKQSANECPGSAC